MSARSWLPLLLLAGCTLIELPEAGQGAGSGGGGTAGAGSGAQGGGGGGPENTCGDHHIDAGEECDDGNTFAGDGCDGCVVECDPADGELEDPTTHHCYFYGEGQTWVLARQLCIDRKMELASITSEREWQSVFPSFTGGTGPWIGGRAGDGGTFAWINDDDWMFDEPWAGPPWADGEPAGTGANDSCVHLVDGAALFATRFCGEENAFLCERNVAGEAR